MSEIYYSVIGSLFTLRYISGTKASLYWITVFHFDVKNVVPFRKLFTRGEI